VLSQASPPLDAHRLTLHLAEGCLAYCLSSPHRHCTSGIFINDGLPGGAQETTIKVVLLSSLLEPSERWSGSGSESATVHRSVEAAAVRAVAVTFTAVTPHSRASVARVITLGASMVVRKQHCHRFITLPALHIELVTCRRGLATDPVQVDTPAESSYARIESVPARAS
jgi:hypothetical protein